MDPVTPVVEDKKNTSFFGKYKFTLISLCIILLALVPLIIISKNNKTQAPANVAKIQVTPTVAPLTQENAAPTIDAVNTKIQSALDQSSQDLQTANQVDTTQDSTTGL